ncbi:MAG: hypothetical protein AB7F86_01205 [Bdellovibrionales bacterium]
MTNKIVSRAILISLVAVATQAWGGDWSIGIGGVVSIGSGGIKVGPQAQGTNIPTPNCGGDICGALERGKNAITGENERRKQEEEYNAKVAELQKVQGELNAINKQIDDVIKATEAEKVQFKSYKARQLESTRTFNHHFETYRREFEGLEKMIVVAQARLKIIRKETGIVSRSAASAVNQLKPFLIELQGISSGEQKSAGQALVEVAKSQGQTEVIARAVAAFQQIANSMGKTLKSSYLALSKMASDEVKQSYQKAMDHVEEGLKQTAQSARSIYADASISKKRNDEMASAIDSTQE